MQAAEILEAFKTITLKNKKSHTNQLNPKDSDTSLVKPAKFNNSTQNYQQLEGVKRVGFRV